MTRQTFTALLFAMMLALTGQSMAVARGASAATGQMVLCTGAGPLAIYVDAKGKPTSAPHICPDSSLNVSFFGPVAVPHAPTRLVVFIAVVSVPKKLKIRRRKALADPRAPPVAV